MESQKVKIIGGIAIAVATALATLIPTKPSKKQNTTDKQSSVTNQSQKKTDLNEWLGQVKHQQSESSNNEKERFLECLQEIKKAVPIRMSQIRREGNEQRWRYFKKDEYKYKATVAEFLKKQTLEMDRIMNEYLQNFNYDQAQFQRLVQTYIQDPAVSGIITSLSVEASSNSGTTVPQSLNVEVFEEMLKFHCEKLEQLSEEENDKDELALAYANTLIVDELTEKFGYNEDQINAAMFFYFKDERFKTYQFRIRKCTFKYMNENIARY